MAKRTYVKLNRILGNGKNEQPRFDCPEEWELVVPIKNADGTFSVPENVYNYSTVFSFMKELKIGKTVLVNSRGGYNYLSKDDIILELYQR